MNRLLLAAVMVSGSLALADDVKPPAPGVSLTVYSAADPAQFDPQQFLLQQLQYGSNRGGPALPGYGVVRDVRKIVLQDGATNVIKITDVAAGIDPTTVKFRSFTDPDASVLEQSFEYDLVSPAKLLQKYVDQKVVIERAIGDGKLEEITGTLLSAENGLVLQDAAGGVRVINGYSGVRLAGAGDLITKPTLVWNLLTQKPGEHLAEISYQTSGITWRSDYSLVLSADETNTDVGSWVTLLNQSGATYPNATLKLVAGDVQRVQPEQYNDRRVMASRAMAVAGEAGAGFKEKSFFEYHLYTLGRPTTINSNSTKQLELFPQKAGVPIEKVYVYYGLPAQFHNWFAQSPMTDRDLGNDSNKKVDIYLRMKNEEQAGLGIPLPAGRVRVYKRDADDGNVEFIGEDVIQHTPKNESLLIKLGSAFDLVGERKQTNFTANEARKEITESFEIKLRNRKDNDPVTILVKENLFRWATWEIIDSSTKWEKQDARTIHFPVDLKPGEEKTVTYTVRYTW